MFVYPCVLQVYTGSYRTQQNCVTVVTNLAGLSVGVLVAVNIECNSSEPLIGTCTTIKDDTIQVEWMKGSYATSWKPWKIREGI